MAAMDTIKTATTSDCPSEMDVAAIARVDSVVLTGLDYSMKPHYARLESSKGFIKPFPELKVMHLIKSLAVTVYNQEKLTPQYHSNVCDRRNLLAYFICAVHRQSPPRSVSDTYSRQNSTSSDKSNSSAYACGLDPNRQHYGLPKLCTTSMLPLGWWDSLYYALIAEIRKLHSDLQDRYGLTAELGNPVLHRQGSDGNTSEPVTATDLAFQLESAWDTLMDNRLVATLDDAVRMLNLRQNAAKAEVGPVEGLIDVNSLSIEDIQKSLWEKHAPEISRACLEESEDESKLSAYRAELRAKEVDGTPSWSASHCLCHHTCVCKVKCDKGIEECGCMSGREKIFHQIHRQECKKLEVHEYYEDVPNQFLGAATNSLAQLQIAAMANPEPVLVQACRNVHEAYNEGEREIASRRQRSDTADSELVYVPAPRDLNRGFKDTYPLAFYGGHSPQRYPRMPAQTATSTNPIETSAYRPSNLTGVPARKPVPPAIVTHLDPRDGVYSQPERYYQEPTPPTSGPYNTTTFTEAGQVTYPLIPPSQSQSMLTQKFPVDHAADPREIYSKQMHVDCDDPANDYINLLGRHPSTINYSEQARVPLPATLRPSPASNPTRAATTNDLPTLKTLAVSKEKPQPPLPELDFISPKPATKQRYVSAGGNAKLSERAEIQGPAIADRATPSGVVMSKKEIDAKMSDPEWIKRTFGEAALGISANTNSLPSRISADSHKSHKRKGSRSSDESERSMVREKRDRTSSGAGANGRVAKLKRIFSSGSRRNSISEME